MKKLLKILPVVMVVCMVVTSVFAVSVPTDDELEGGSPATNVELAAKGIWKTVVTIVQILSVAAVVFAGLRYMFASADQKADIKKSMGVLAIGAVLVFGATLILGFIDTATSQVIPSNQQQQQQQQQP